MSLGIAEVSLRNALLMMCVLLRASACSDTPNADARAAHAAKAVSSVESLPLRPALALALPLLLPLALSLLHPTATRRGDPVVLRIRFIGCFWRAAARACTRLWPARTRTLPAESHEALRAAAVQRLAVLRAAALPKSERVLRLLVRAVALRLLRVVVVPALLVKPLRGPIRSALSLRLRLALQAETPLSLLTRRRRAPGSRGPREHRRIFDERWRYAVARVVRAAVVLILRVRIVVVRHGRRVTLLPLRACGRRRLLLARALYSCVLLLSGLGGGRRKRTAGRLLGHTRETFDVLVSKGVTVPKCRLLVSVVEAL